MDNKQFKNLEEQVEILKFKGLTITEVEGENDKKYIKGSTFEELYSLFLFDRNLRNILFKNLLIVENNLKSIISYQLSKKYGYREKDYLKENNFTENPEKKKQVNDLISKMKRQVRANGAQHSATMHYITNYGYIPLWIMVKVLSFGIVSEMYSILKEEDQNEISKVYKVSVDNMILYLPILANYRNLCAHEDILYENRTQKSIDNTVYHQLLNIEKDEYGEYKYGKNDLFALLIILRQVLQYEEFQNMMLEIERAIEHLAYNLNSISIEKVLERMGFPHNWMDLAKIVGSGDVDE